MRQVRETEEERRGREGSRTNSPPICRRRFTRVAFASVANNPVSLSRRMLADLSAFPNLSHVSLKTFFDIADRYGVTVLGRNFIIPSKWPRHMERERPTPGGGPRVVRYDGLDGPNRLVQYLRQTIEMPWYQDWSKVRGTGGGGRRHGPRRRLRRDGETGS